MNEDYKWQPYMLQIAEHSHLCTLEKNILGFFPYGEGSGYAGGIISAAINGEKCADKY
jgi:uncharacterized FAD-dependent dehydrogenase